MVFETQTAVLMQPIRYLLRISQKWQERSRMILMKQELCSASIQFRNFLTRLVTLLKRKNDQCTVCLTIALRT